MACCSQSDKPFNGRVLKINHKMKRVSLLEDKDCWFCFKNPKIEKELIIKESSDNEFYLAMPKGPLVDEHFLVVPKQHIASSMELTPQQTQDYLSQKMYVTAYLNSRSLDFIVFERNMKFKFQKAAHMNT